MHGENFRQEDRIDPRYPVHPLRASADSSAGGAVGKDSVRQWAPRVPKEKIELVHEVGLALL